MFLSYSWTALQSQMKGLSSLVLVEFVTHVLVSNTIFSTLWFLIWYEFSEALTLCASIYVHADPANALVIVQCGGIPLIIQCLSSPVRNTVSISEASKRRFCSLGGYISDGFVLFSTLCSCLQFSSHGYITGDLCTWGFVLSMQPCDKERDPETWCS